MNFGRWGITRKKAYSRKKHTRKERRESMKQGVKEERRDSVKGMETEGKIQRKEAGKRHLRFSAMWLENVSWNVSLGRWISTVRRFETS